MVLNPNQITAELRSMSDAQLQQYAMMHKDDPYILPMALSESNTRKQMRAQKMAQAFQPQPTERDKALMTMQANAMEERAMRAPGLAALRAPVLEQIPDGGIAGYEEPKAAADGGMMYAKGGSIADYADLIRSEAERQGMDPDLAMRLFATESAGDPRAKSPKGAVGLGQLMPDTAKEMGLSEQDRYDPAKNIRASIGYFVKQQQKYGDIRKALAAYNWGPGNLDKHLAKNEGKLNTIGLPKETANYLTKILPISEARAEAAPTTDREKLISQIPGQTEAGRAAPAAPERTIGQRLMGAGEAALSTASGLAALPAASVAGFYGALTSGKYGTPEGVRAGEQRAAEVQRAMTYAPRTEAGREYVGDIGEVAEGLKLPPYIPTVGAPGRTAAAGRAAREAEIAAAEAAAAEGKVAAPRIAGPGPRVMSPEEAATAKAKVESPRLPPPDATPEQLEALRAAQRADVEAASQARQAPVLAREAEAKQKTALEALRQDQEAAAAATARAGETAQQSALERVLGERRASDAAYAEQVAGRAGATGAAAVGAEQAGPAPTPPAPVSHIGKMSEEQKDLIADAAEKAAGESKETSGWSKDDWLNFGFALLANRSPYFMEALGTAGLKTLAARKEKEESDINRMAKQALGEKYKAEAEYVKTEKAREGLRRAAVQLSQSQIAALRANPKTLAMTEEQRKAAEEQIINDNFSRLLRQQGLEAPETTTTAVPSAPAGNRPPLSSFQK